MELFLHMPEESELSYRRHLIADEATMAYNAGFGDGGGCTYRRTPEEVQAWYRHWNHGTKNFYAYVVRREDNVPVGEVALRGELDRPLINVLLEARWRGRGYGAEALRLLLEHAFFAMNLPAVYDDFPPSRLPAERTFAAAGFTRTDEGLLCLTRKAFCERRGLSL